MFELSLKNIKSNFKTSTSPNGTLS